MLLSFELTMPNVGSWNGKWSGAENKYYSIRKVSKLHIKSKEHLSKLVEKGSSSFYYNFGDGWGAKVFVEIIDGKEAAKRRKISAGFCGYEWMIDSILKNGKIES